MAADTGSVITVSASPGHGFSKAVQASIKLIEGRGVEGDGHAGETVQHLSRIKRDPTQPNLRQVHLIHSELLEELGSEGFNVKPGDLGENLMTRDIPLLSLPRGTRLHIGPLAVVELTGLRNPCAQIENFQAGLLKAVLDKDDEGNLVRKAGVMGIVLKGGEVAPGDPIRLELPAGDQEPLAPV